MNAGDSCGGLVKKAQDLGDAEHPYVWHLFSRQRRLFGGHLEGIRRF